MKHLRLDTVIDIAVIVASCAIMAGMVFLVFWPNLVLNTLHLDDVLFIADLGVRRLNGAIATVDYEHFLGGMTAYFAALAIQVFGPSAKVVEHAALLQCAAILLLLAVVSWRRLALTPTLLLAAFVTVICLTRAPLEMFNGIPGSLAAHSFIYNKVATATAIVLGAFAVVRGRVPMPAEIAVGALCGGALYAMALLKPTFIAYAPFFLLAVGIMGRWAALAGAVIGLGLSVTLWDPGAQILLNSWSYASSQMTSQAETFQLLNKAVRLLFLQFAVFAVCVALLIAFFNARGWAFVRPALAITVLTCGGLLMAVTMGGIAVINSQALPFLLAAPVYAVISAGPVPGTARLVALALPFGLMVPHFANMAESSVDARRVAWGSMIDTGPMSNYVAYDLWFIFNGRRTVGDLDEIKEAVEYALPLLHFEDPRPQLEYVALTEAIEMLGGIENIEDYGVLTNSRAFHLAFATGAQPVLSYLTFPQWRSPSIAERRPLEDDADIVMLAWPGYDAGVTVTSALEEMMGDDYDLCMTGIHWEMHVRKSSDIPECSPTGALRISEAPD